MNHLSDTVSAEIGNADGAAASSNYFDSDVHKTDLVSSLHFQRDRIMSSPIRSHKYVLRCFQSVNLIE